MWIIRGKLLGGVALRVLPIHEFKLTLSRGEHYKSRGEHPTESLKPVWFFSLKLISNFLTLFCFSWRSSKRSWSRRGSWLRSVSWDWNGRRRGTEARAATTSRLPITRLMSSATTTATARRPRPTAANLICSRSDPRRLLPRQLFWNVLRPSFSPSPLSLKWTQGMGTSSRRRPRTCLVTGGRRLGARGGWWTPSASTTFSLLVIDPSTQRWTSKWRKATFPPSRVPLYVGDGLTLKLKRAVFLATKTGSFECFEANCPRDWCRLLSPQLNSVNLLNLHRHNDGIHSNSIDELFCQNHPLWWSYECGFRLSRR